MIYVFVVSNVAWGVFAAFLVAASRSDRQTHRVETRELVDRITLMKVEPRAVAAQLQVPDDMADVFVSPLDDEALAELEANR